MRALHSLAGLHLGTLVRQVRSNGPPLRSNRADTGNCPVLLVKRLSYVGNAVFQLIRLAEARPQLIDRQTLHLGDYQPRMSDSGPTRLPVTLGMPEPRPLLRRLAHAMALAGDLLEGLG